MKRIGRPDGEFLVAVATIFFVFSVIPLSLWLGKREEVVATQYDYLKQQIEEKGLPVKNLVDQYMEDDKISKWEYERIKSLIDDIDTEQAKRCIR